MKCFASKACYEINPLIIAFMPAGISSAEGRFHPEGISSAKRISLQPCEGKVAHIPKDAI